MKKVLTLLISCLIIPYFLIAQRADDKFNLEDFDISLLTSLVNERLDELRMANQLDGMIRHEILDAAAIDQASDNMKNQKVDQRDDIGKRISKNGGTENGQFMATYVSAMKGKVAYTYSQIVSDIMSKFTKSKRNKANLLIPENFYAGLGATVNPEKKRIYFSLVMGKLNVLNAGADKNLRKSLPVKYSKKKYGLSGYDSRVCKGCEKFENWDKLYNGISIVEKKIYLEYDNLELKRLLRKSTDGLLVDFVMKEQYPCGGENIYNLELQTKGAAAKPGYVSKIFKKNEVEGPRPKSFYGPIGKIKSSVIAGLPDGYEMNVIVIQNKAVCKTIRRGYLEDGGTESLTLFSIYPDTASNTTVGEWKPVAEKNTLEFKVPFEQGKSNYKPGDIEPFLKALDEPKYAVNEIFIEAHSSLEGDSMINKRLQRERAESMIRAIEKIQGDANNLLKEDNIKTSYAWEIFQKQITEDSNYEYFRGMSFGEVYQLMRNDQEVYNKLEPLLDEQRFAKVKMNITYDIGGENEQPFVASQLKKAIEAKDGAKALKIQKHALRKLMDGTYELANFDKIEIPDEEPLASVMINRVFIENYLKYDGELSEEFAPIFEKIYATAPDNGFASFNKHLMDVKFGKVTSTKQIQETQAAIQKLYASRIPTKFVDALNLEFQFKVMEGVDSIEASEELVNQSLQRIKNIFKIEGSSWQNALKLGYIFISYKDLDYATNVMGPFIEDDIPDEEFYFTYISAAAPDEQKIFTRNFRMALSKAKEMNKSRYCKLFGEPYLSFQLLDHPIVKKEYCNSCK